MKLYHRTSTEAAVAILTTGFRDNTGSYMTTNQHTGVWVSNVPLDENEGAGGDAVLEVSVEETEIAKHEWVQEPSFGYREWLAPAELLNRHAQVRLLNENEVDELATPRWNA